MMRRLADVDHHARGLELRGGVSHISLTWRLIKIFIFILVLNYNFKFNENPGEKSTYR